jgi:hypothetical protein
MLIFMCISVDKKAVYFHVCGSAQICSLAAAASQLHPQGAMLHPNLFYIVIAVLVCAFSIISIGQVVVD